MNFSDHARFSSRAARDTAVLHRFQSQLTVDYQDILIYEDLVHDVLIVRWTIPVRGIRIETFVQAQIQDLAELQTYHMPATGSYLSNVDVAIVDYISAAMRAHVEKLRRDAENEKPSSESAPISSIIDGLYREFAKQEL